MSADLTSTRSARVTEVRHLYDRRHRAERGAFVVEGPQAVREALQTPRRDRSAGSTAMPGVLELYLTEAAAQRYPQFLDRARECGARTSFATDEVLSAMSETRHPQGVIAVCPLVTRPLGDIVTQMTSPAPLVVVLDRVADPGNAGTIIRTADAMGADAVILTEGSVDPHNGKCVRSTAGSIFHVPISADAPVAEVMQVTEAAGLAVIAADARAAALLDDARDLLRGPVVWVFGNEAHGVDADWRDAAVSTVRIPMAGDAESLNLAAAAAICLYATSHARSGT